MLVSAIILLSSFVMASAPVFGPFNFIEDTTGTIDVGSYGAPCVADWDGDGLKDLIIGQFTGGGKIRFYANSGSNSVPVFTTFSYMQSDNAYPVHSLTHYFMSGCHDQTSQSQTPLSFVETIGNLISHLLRTGP